MHSKDDKATSGGPYQIKTLFQCNWLKGKHNMKIKQQDGLWFEENKWDGLRFEENE